MNVRRWLQCDMANMIEDFVHNASSSLLIGTPYEVEINGLEKTRIE